MQTIAEESIRGGWFAHSFDPPNLAGIFLAKLTCRLVPGAVSTMLTEEGVEELSGDVPLADDPAGPLKITSDFAPYKPRCDLLLNATSYSPSRRPETNWNARWSVGKWSKAFSLFGDRRWIVEPLSTRIGPPAPIAEVPLDHRFAFGGPTSKTNPLGKGFGWEAQQLPNVESGRLVTSPGDRNESAGAGPIGLNWPARQQYVGTYGQRWQRERWPWFPEDFDYAYFNAAPRDQQLDGGLVGDEELAFDNLHPKHATFRTRLPGVRVRCFVSESPLDASELNLSDFREVPLQCDTLQIDLHRELATLLFRGQTPIRSLKMSELQTVFMMTEPVAGPPLSPAECLARLRSLSQGDEDQAVDPAAQAAEEAEQQQFDLQMEQLEAEHAEAMKEAEKHEAAAHQRALAAGIEATKLNPPQPLSLAEMRSQMVEMAGALQVSHPAKAQELTAQIAAIDELEAAEAEMQADEAGGPLTREEVQRMAAAGESFRGRSLVDLELYDLTLTGLDFSDADFSECMLDGADLSGANLTNANFSQADLTQANLAGANLSNAVFTEADLTQVNFSNACLDHADFSDAIVEGCTFAGASLHNANLSQLDLTGASFRGAHGRAADFSEAKLAGADFRESHLPQADFGAAVLNEARFERARLPEASFEGASASRVSMQRTDLTGLHASDQADFSGSDFSGCTAEGSVWEESSVERCNFTESTLNRAIFTAARLAGATLARSQLCDTVFDDADLTGVNLNQCNLLRASLERAKLVNASLREANIYRAGFWDAQLAGLDRRGTQVIGTVLSNE